jgi:hypothetical protein
MKTSTKLLIIFFTCVPLSLWAYNSLLKKQLDAHNIVMEFRPDPAQTYTEEKLQPFKYVVVNGALTFGEKNETNISWQPKVKFGDNVVNTTNAINIIRGYDKIVNHRISNDTLYVTFHKNGFFNTDPYGYYDPEVVRITANDLHSVDASNARFDISGNLKTAKKLKIVLDGKSNMYISNMLTERLDLIVKDASEVNLQANNFNDLYYDLPDKGRLTVDVYSAKHFHPGIIDSLAWINVQGQARQLKQLLKP